MACVSQGTSTDVPRDGSRLVRPMTLLILVAVAVLRGAAQTPPRLVLQIEFDRQEWVTGEPVIAYVAVRNTGGVSTAVRFAPEPEFGRCRYVIRHDGASRAFLPWALKDSTVEPEPLNPGQALAFPVKLFAGSDGFTFRDTGTYSVQVTCSGVPDPASVEVRVLAPRSPLEASQSQSLLNDPDVGLFFLFEGGDHLVSAKAVLQNIATSTTVFQPYARVVLGLSAAREFASMSSGTLRPADPVAARNYLASPPDASVPGYYLLARKRALELMAARANDAAAVARYRQEIAAELARGTHSAVAIQALRQTFQR
jgi:hypothetical protein